MANDENLIPYKPGYDERRGRKKMFDTPEELDQLAGAISEGLSNAELGRCFNCSVRTIRAYRKDPTIRQLVFKLIEDRVSRITRKTDSVIEARLAKAEDLDTDTILKIRKEFLGGAMRQITTGDKRDDRTINAALEEMEAKPELGAELQKLLAAKAE